MNNLKNTQYFEISKKLISFDTVSNNPNGECASFVSNCLSDLGFDVQIEHHQDGHHKKEQIIATIGPKVPDGIILSGHMDTVPFENQPGWTMNPLELQVKDDKLFGRGTCDMKLFIAQCLEAFKDLDLKALKKPIVCIFTADEEVGCLGAHRLTTKLDSLLGKVPMPKRAIIGEPTSFEFINTHKGIVHFDIEITGIAGHSSRPDLGKNSITPLGKIIELINSINFEYQNSLDPELKKLFPDFPYNYLHMATLHGGIALNMIPEKTVLQISYRSFPTDDSKLVLNSFKEKLKHLGFSDQVTITNVMDTPSMPMAKDLELENALKLYTGYETPRSVSFATDGGYLSQLGINCYVCGPREIKMAHQPDEYMPIADFLSGPELIKNLLRKIVF